MVAVPDGVAALTATAVRVLTALYLVTLMFAMGLELGADREDKQTKRRKRRWLIRALLFNLIALPVIAIGVVSLVHPSAGVDVALVLLAATPGGRFAPQLAKLARADRALSVEITLFLFKIAPFTAPVVVKWMLHARRVDVHDLTFIAELLVLQILPYAIGKRVRRHRAVLADRLLLPMRAISITCLILILTFLLLHRELGVLWQFKVRDWLSVLVCAAVSLGLAWLAGGRTATTRRSFAVSANARNLALALVIANLAFPNSRNQLDVFGVWIVFLGFNYGFAALSRRRRSELVSGPTSAPHGVPAAR